MTGAAVDPGLVDALETLLRPGPDPAACSPRMFGRWPGGKSFDEWFTVDAISVLGQDLRLSFNDGGDVLTVERPGRWWPADDAVVIADARRVHLQTQHDYAQFAHVPNFPPSFRRVLEYRTEHGAVIDQDGRRTRWYPPGSPPRPWHLGASNAPAVEMLLLWPRIHRARASGR